MKKIIIIVTVIALVVAGYLIFGKKKKPVVMEELRPERGSIAVEVRLNGNVNPRNRLEIKPQVSGRIDDVLVVEGQEVKKGQILAWMSSTDRAALLDAARSRGEAELKKWEDVYKPTPIMAPLNGFIIARNKEPGQSVTQSDALLVMADKLIVEANVDETDLKYMRLGQVVRIFLDAYPDRSFPGTVEHIAYESQLINNVTVYTVKIRPDRVPESFRAGMTATMQLMAQQKDDVLLVPAGALTTTDSRTFVTVKNADGKTSTKRVTVGISNGKNTEITEGLTEEDTIVMPQSEFQSSTRGMRGPGSLFGIGTKKK